MASNSQYPADNRGGVLPKSYSDLSKDSDVRYPALGQSGFGWPVPE